MKQKYLFISDFDKTLSREDSGYFISEKIGISSDAYEEKVKALRQKNLVQLGGELAYLVTRDNDFKGKITKDLLRQVGEETRLKKNVSQLVQALKKGIDDKCFSVFIATAAPTDLVASALKEIIPETDIFGTTFIYNDKGVVVDLKETGAGDAKVAIVDLLKMREKVPRDRIIYVGDGLSDMRVMLHVNIYNGYPIAVSGSSYLGHISHRTVISDTASAVLIPILEDILGYSESKIIDFFSNLKTPIGEWKRAKVEWVDFHH